MLELLLYIFIIASLSLLAISFNINDYSHFLFMNEYLDKQIDSFVNKRTNDYRNGIRFNEKGHVNNGRTVEINGRKIIVHLGNGYITYE